jgi:hypothetical protein
MVRPVDLTDPVTTYAVPGKGILSVGSDGKGLDLLEGPGVQERFDALAGGHLALFVLALDPVSTPSLQGLLLHGAKFFYARVCLLLHLFSCFLEL